MDSVYILVALEMETIKECIVLSDLDDALNLREKLINLYGGSKVLFASRSVDDVPLLLKDR